MDKANAQPLDLSFDTLNSGGGRGTEVYTYNGEVFKQAELVCEKYGGAWVYKQRYEKTAQICMSFAEVMRGLCL